MTNPNEYQCDSCAYVYKLSDFEDRDLDDQPQDWICPDCQASKDHFHLIVPPSDDIVSSTGSTDESDVSSEVNLLGERIFFTEKGNPDVAGLQRRYKKRRLDPRPDFQRYEVWTPQKKSKLIESILLDLPIPQIYLAQEADGTSVVVDGQQRLMALFRYLDDEYALKDVHPQIAGKTFTKLPGALQERIENYNMTTVEILSNSDPEVKFLLFRRLNEGSTSLNDQELRNSVHRGDYNEFLKELAKDKRWREILNLRGKDPHKRMVDVELVLRFMAFRDQSYMNHPDKRTSQFLDTQMVDGQRYKKRDYDKARTAFRTAIELAQMVYGKRACRRFVAGDEDNPNGTWDSKINRALMDVQLWGFTRHSKNALVPKADKIFDASLDLMSDLKFVDLISHTISESKRVEQRFDMWKQMLDAVIGDEKANPRFFPRSVKETLFEQDPSCARCKQKIQMIDDAHVDHVKAYAKGGKTEIANAALLHRFCNSSKGAKEA